MQAYHIDVRTGSLGHDGLYHACVVQLHGFKVVIARDVRGAGIDQNGLWFYLVDRCICEGGFDHLFCVFKAQSAVAPA